MQSDNKPELTDIRELAGLSDSQRERLANHGIVFVETFLSAARSDAAALVELISCSGEEMQALRDEAEKLAAIDFELAEAPPVPPFGLLPPSDRAADDELDEETGREDEQ